MRAKLTNPALVSWYLFGLFLLGVNAISAVSVIPEARGMVALTMFLCLACALVAADLAICLQYCARHGLGLGIFGSAAYRQAYATAALVVTVILMVAVR